ncbi:MAG TPA: cytochrome b/b6 domain-containing protein [Vicinamibacteria bacterium]|nr:cytochrome b/b6 domain-containing protein [Vicinamibacteria bacterium]
MAEERVVAGGTHVVRFRAFERALHGVLMVSFLGLAFTGAPLLFADQEWALRLATFLGGYGVTGKLHRFFGALMIVIFMVHVARVLHRVLVKKETGILWGPDSLVPQPSDALQLVQHFRWFVGLGPRPRFDRFTYWEKFDYWAVFWGMGIIGTSGVLLWLPQVFSRFLPGWLFNIALVVHGEEALLAVVFIFTVHFFNGHLRPEKYPMDTVIFTGRVPLHEMKEERPAEYERLRAQGGLEEVLAPAPSPELVTRGRIVGTIAVLMGLTMVALIVYALMS